MSPAKPTTQKSISTYLIWQIVAYGVLAVLCASVIGSIYFMYSYFYQTIADVQTIVVLNANTPLSSLNTTNYTKAEKIVTTKNTPVVLPTDLRNIFLFGAGATASTTPRLTPPSQPSYARPRS